jgi:hypothetical protein
MTMPAEIVLPKLNLIQKLALIRREIPNVEKKGHNDHFKYDFMRAEDVVGDIGDQLAKHNIMLGKENLHVEIHQLDKGVLAVTTCTYVFIDGDSGERFLVDSAGGGIDGQDKSVSKSLTAAIKYAITQGLCLRVGHIDPEDDGATKKQGTQPPVDSGAPQTAKKGIPVSAASLKVLELYVGVHPDELEPMLTKTGKKALADLSEPQAQILLKKIQTAHIDGPKTDHVDNDIGF